MKIIGQALYPLFWGLGIAKLAVCAVANRFFLETYVFYHSFRKDEKWREIEKIDKAISALEKRDFDAAKTTHLPEILKQSIQLVLMDVNADMVLEALKTHRFSIRQVWSGVEENETLIQYISDYITPVNSPLRSSSAPPRGSNLVKRKLFNTDPLTLLPDATIEEIKRLLIGQDPLHHATHPLLFFHTVRFKTDLQEFLSQGAFREKLEGYAERAGNWSEYLQIFAETHKIDQKQLEAHIQAKKWKEFVALCLP